MKKWAALIFVFFITNCFEFSTKMINSFVVRLYVSSILLLSEITILSPMHVLHNTPFGHGGQL